MQIPLMSPGLVPLWKIFTVAFLFILHLILGLIAFISDISWLSGMIMSDPLVDHGRTLILTFGSAKLSVDADGSDNWIVGFPAVLTELGDQCDETRDQPQSVCQDVLAWRFACDVMVACGLTSLAIWILAMVVVCCAHNYPLALWYAPRVSLVHTMLVTISYTVGLIGIGFSPEVPGNTWTFGGGMFLVTV